MRGIPWELSAPRPAAGERLIAEDRLVVPLPPPEERLAPPQRRRLYIRREDVHKHGATDGCPGCKCVLEDRRTTVPHTEACRARIIEAMEKDETGAERIQSHAKRRKDSQATERQKPAVVSTGEKDLSVEDAEGRPREQAVRMIRRQKSLKIHKREQTLKDRRCPCHRQQSRKQNRKLSHSQ